MLEDQSGSSASCRGNTENGACATLKKSTEPVNWNLCIFCQTVYSKEHLSSVMTFKMSDKILKAAPLDYKICLHLAGMIDLMAAEAKYHLTCFRAFTRSTGKRKEVSAHGDLAMVWICMELQYAAKN